MNNELNELNSCIANIREYITKSCLNISCDDIVIHIHEPIDTDKFKTWFDYNLDKFKNKSNQASYFKKAFENELNKGTFILSKTYYVPDTQPIVNELRDKAIPMMAEDTAWVFVAFSEMRNRYQISKLMYKEIHRQAVEGLNIRSDFNHYKKLIKASPLLKNYNIDWRDIDLKTAKFNKEWNKTLDEMESCYE